MGATECVGRCGRIAEEHVRHNVRSLAFAQTPRGFNHGIGRVAVRRVCPEILGVGPPIQRRD